MKKLIEMEIKSCEDRLRQAMLQSDVTTLDDLLATDLIFTNHFGQIMTKQDDLELHQSGKLKINEIILTDIKNKLCDNIVIVSVQAYIVGSFSGVESKSNFRFTRVWNRVSSEAWQVVAGHSSIIV